MKRTTAQKAYLVGMLIMSVFVLASSAIAAGPTPVNLGTSGDFVILAETGTTTTGTTTVVANLRVNPIAATAVTGFGPIADSTNSCDESECSIHTHRDERTSSNGGTDEQNNSK